MLSAHTRLNKRLAANDLFAFFRIQIGIVEQAHPEHVQKQLTGAQPQFFLHVSRPYRPHPS